MHHIISAAQESGVNPGILGAAIYTEQIINVTYTEGLEDWAQMMLAMDCSVGISQVRISTAKKIEDAGYMPVTGGLITYGTRYITGKAVTVQTIKSRDETLYYKLTDNETNIKYAAAYLAWIQDIWRDSYPENEGKTAILIVNLVQYRRT